MSDPTTEPREVRVKRLYMRSIRRGIKEMDVILTKFADLHLSQMSDAELDAYEALLAEADQDLYQWVSGQQEGPAEHGLLIRQIMSEFKQ